jgi:hypothetical protein
VEEELIASTLKRFTTSVQRKRTHILVERTPSKPPTIERPAPGRSPKASLIALSAPPSFTALVRLTKGGREKKVTKKIKEAREQG